MPREPISNVSNCSHITLCIQNGQRCLECDDDFQEDNHLRNIAKCAKCKYQTACSRAILEHTTNCNGECSADNTITSPLGNEWFCICGYSSSEGKNKHYINLIVRKIIEMHTFYNIIFFNLHRQ